MESGLKGKRAVLVGLGRSSVGAARLLLREGAAPFITDNADGDRLAPWKTACDTLGVPYETGGHGDGVVESADLIVPSPGVPAALPPLEAARRRGVPVAGELELASRFCAAPMLAVTGTNGKTTVTELLRSMVEACGKSAALAGNNDTPLSEAVLLPERPDWVVVEVSSYQMETADRFHPRVAAVLNVTPDHLKRHGTLEAYAAMKARVFARQGGGDAAVRNAADPRVAVLPVPEGVRRVPFSAAGRLAAGVWTEDGAVFLGADKIMDPGDNPLPGAHNLENVMAALAVMAGAGLPLDRAVAALRAFRGVEHRIEFVLRDPVRGCDYYNDSKSTNVDSLRVALESFDRPVVLIAGGRGKGDDYRPLRETVRRHAVRLVTMGEDAPLLEAAFGDAVPAERADGMDDAVARARAGAAPGWAVLLSPACASFDLYNNFEERGRDFKRAVRAVCGLPPEETLEKTP